MEVAVALDWDETLVTTVESDNSQGGWKYVPRPGLPDFLRFINAYNCVQFIGIFSLGMVLERGSSSLEDWGLKTWGIDKLAPQLMIKPAEWRTISKRHDLVILLEDTKEHANIKVMIGGFKDKVEVVMLPRYECRPEQNFQPAIEHIKEILG